jgi:hypothetical protein
MRHATQEDLDRLEGLLAELRGIPGLRERTRGYFSRGSRAFLHFHEDGGNLYADVKLDSKFQRMKVSSGTEQDDFLSRVREALSAGDAKVLDHDDGAVRAGGHQEDREARG